jgi:hypothetical protein
MTAPWASERKAHRRPLDDDATLRAPVQSRCRYERSRGEDDIPVSTHPHILYIKMKEQKILPCLLTGTLD